MGAGLLMAGLCNRMNMRKVPSVGGRLDFALICLVIVGLLTALAGITKFIQSKSPKIS